MHRAGSEPGAVVASVRGLVAPGAVRGLLVRGLLARGLLVLVLLVLMLLGGLLGCVTAAPPLELPDRFLVLDTDVEEGFKAITPEEAKVWVRVFDEPGGDVGFWSEALRRDLIDQRGYVLLGERDLATRSGHPGHELRCETSATGRPLSYLIAVVVQPRGKEVRLVVVEYVGAKGEAFDRYLPDVQKAIEAL